MHQLPAWERRLVTALEQEAKRANERLLLSGRSCGCSGPRVILEAESIFTAQPASRLSCDLPAEDLQRSCWPRRPAVSILTPRGKRDPDDPYGPVGPRRLAYRGTSFPSRLTSRLAGGLVVALEPLQAPSRKLFLAETAQRRQLPLAPDVVDWLGERLVANGRQLEGALTQLQTLARLGKRLDLPSVMEHFRPQIEAAQPSLGRILEEVGGYFQVKPKDLQSKRRYHDVLLAAGGNVPGPKADEAFARADQAPFRGRDHDGAARLPQSRGRVPRDAFLRRRKGPERRVDLMCKSH